MPVMSLDMQTLQADLERIPAGEEVHISLLTQGPPTEDQMQGLADTFASSGVELLAPVRSAVMEWDGYQVSAIDLDFRNPGTPAPGTTGLLPLLLLGGVLALGFGYVLWKGGEIAEDTVGSLVKMVIPMTLILGGIYLVSQMSKARQ